MRIRNIPLKKARKEILAYFEKFKEAFPSEAANTLRIDLETTHKIVKELINEKLLEVIN